jgi:ferrous iron transport protein A
MILTPSMHRSSEPFRPQRMRLTDLPIGAAGRVCQLEGEANVCARLREMGFCESAVIEKVAGEKTLLCQLCNVRIALSDRAAQHIVVELVRGGLG